MRSGLTSFFLLTLMTLSKVAPAQLEQGSSLEPSKYVEQSMKIQVGFMEMVPPGMSIEARELSRKGKSGNNLVVQYHIFVKGAPPDTLFQEMQWPVGSDKPSAALSGISVGKDGILICAGKEPDQCGDASKPNDPIEFTSIPKRGEPTRLAFIAPDFRIGLTFVPDPIEGKDKGCTLSATRLTPKFELAFLSGSGYAVNTDVHYRMASNEKTNDAVVRSDAKGGIRFSVIPYPGKKKNGAVSVKITENSCSPEVTYEWGKL